jgi:hypothetical protein
MATWKEAQGEVIGLLAEVRTLVDAEDESGVLELINQQDAFCDKAKERQAMVSSEPGETRCNFCEGYIQSGGCMDRLGAIDHAVLHGEWETAGRLVDEYSDWVKSLIVEP